MQTLSPTISPTIAPKIAKTINKFAESEIDSFATSSVLQTSLTGLDASLNDELDRYRHWQTNGQTISYLNPFRPRTVATQSIWSSPSLSDALSPIAPPTDTNSDRRTIQMPVMLPIGASASPINISSAELHKYKGLDSLDLPENNDLVENLSYAQNLDSYANVATGIDSPLMAKVPEPDDDDEILQSFANDYADNYQESINQDTQFPIPSAANERNALRSLMNPVGVISLLLLLCSSAALGYLMVDPSGVMKLFKPESRPKAAQTDGKSEDLGGDINLRNQQKSSDSSLSFVPFAGDKTQSETTNKNTLANPAIASKNPLSNPSAKSSSLFVPSNNSFVPSFVPNAPLRTVPSTDFPTMSVAPLPPALAPIERSYNPPARTYEAPSAPAYSEPQRSSTRSTSSSSNRANPSVAPTTAYVAPSPPVYVEPRNNTAVKYAAPLSSAPVQAPAQSPTQSPTQSSYRVVVENSYAASAQQVERDAYVRPSDGQVQVGSYRDSNSAQHRIEQLRRQGIPARIE